MLLRCEALAVGGVAGLGRYMVAHATGDVTHTQLDGRPALRFDFQAGFGSTERYWLDARTWEVRQSQDLSDTGTPIGTYTYVILRFLPPGTLPSLLDTAPNWVRQHMGEPSQP